MTFVKVVLLAVLAINLQGAYSDPGHFGNAVPSAYILKIAEKSRSMLDEAVKLGMVTKPDSDILKNQINEAARQSKLCRFQEIDISLNSGVDKAVITNAEKVGILGNAIRNGLHKNTGGPLEGAVNAVIDAAVTAHMLTPERSAQLKAVCPKFVIPNINAVVGKSDLHEYWDNRPSPPA